MLQPKSSQEVCVMPLNGDAEFKGKLTRGLKNDIRNLVLDKKVRKSHVS